MTPEETRKLYKQSKARARRNRPLWASSQTKPGSISDVLRRYALDQITSKEADAEVTKIIERGGC